jgi:hypothetical protein
MRDLPSMCIAKRRGDLPNHAGRHFLVDVLVLHDAVEELSAFAIFHDEVCVATLIVEFVQLADIRVVEVFHELHLGIERIGKSAIRILDNPFDDDNPILYFSIPRDEDLSVTSFSNFVCINVVSLPDINLNSLWEEAPDIHRQSLPAGLSTCTRLIRVCRADPFLKELVGGSRCLG